jgi:hypothetical protein
VSRDEYYRRLGIVAEMMTKSDEYVRYLVRALRYSSSPRSGSNRSCSPKMRSGARLAIQRCSSTSVNRMKRLQPALSTPQVTYPAASFGKNSTFCSYRPSDRSCRSGMETRIDYQASINPPILELVYGFFDPVVHNHHLNGDEAERTPHRQTLLPSANAASARLASALVNAS